MYAANAPLLSNFPETVCSLISELLNFTKFTYMSCSSRFFCFLAFFLSFFLSFLLSDWCWLCDWFWMSCCIFVRSSPGSKVDIEKEVFCWFLAINNLCWLNMSEPHALSALQCRCVMASIMMVGTEILTFVALMSEWTILALWRVFSPSSTRLCMFLLNLPKSSVDLSTSILGQPREGPRYSNTRQG